MVHYQGFDLCNSVRNSMRFTHHFLLTKTVINKIDKVEQNINPAKRGRRRKNFC